jgi:hypothetical protein
MKAFGITTLSIISLFATLSITALYNYAEGVFDLLLC